jgi:hypothetical protein
MEYLLELRHPNGGVETVLDPMTPAKVLALLPRDG